MTVIDIFPVQKLSGDLPIQSQKVKKLKANVHYVIHSVPAESADEYRARWHVLQARWDLLESELSSRVAELNFEKEQKVKDRQFNKLHCMGNSMFRAGKKMFRIIFLNFLL